MWHGDGVLVGRGWIMLQEEGAQAVESLIQENRSKRKEIDEDYGIMD